MTSFLCAREDSNFHTRRRCRLKTVRLPISPRAHFFKQKYPKNRVFSVIYVGVAGFEPTTSTSQMWRDTGLRYTPKF
jgi:hypothetical protein